MKQIYALAASLAVAASCVAAPLVKMPAKVKYRTDRTALTGRAASPLKLRRAAETPAPVYRPRTQTVYASDEQGGWIKDSDIHSQWTATGRPLREVIVTDADGVFYTQVIENTYDDRGLLVEQLVKEGDSEQTAVPVGKLVRSYDERMPWVVTSSMNYAPDATGEWVINHNANNYRNTVTRDAAGNVLSVVRATVFEDGWYDNTKFEVTYGADGKPSELAFYNYDYWFSEWVLDSKYVECSWETCDGQLARFDDACENGNRLVGFRDADSEEVSEPVEVLYPTADSYVMCTEEEGMPLYQQILLYGDRGYRVTAVQQIEYLGETYVYGGGYVEELDDLDLIKLNYEVSFSDGGIDEVGVWLQAHYEYADNGDPGPASYTLSEFYQLLDDEEWDDSGNGYYALMKAAAKPSVAKSAPRKVTVADLPDFTQYYFDAPGVEGEWYEMMRIEFSDYTNCAGIENVSADTAADLPAEYFTIDGRRVAEPGAGLYICRRGNTATKVMVR